MSRSKLSDLNAVTTAAFETTFQKLRPILEEEARIQNQLTELDTQVFQVKSDASATKGYRVAGADVVWHSWEAATRRTLNIELARIRSRKLAMLDDLRTAFGRKQAVETLCRNHAVERRRKSRKKQLDQPGL